MKSISRKPLPYLKVIIGLLILLCVLGGVYAYVNRDHLFSDSTSESTSRGNTPPTKEQTQAGSTLKTDIVNNDRAAQGKPPIPGTSTSNASTDTNAGTLGVTITAASQNGSVVNIRSLIETVTNNGTCTLTLTKDSAIVTKTAGIQPLANASTCKGFDIPTSELSSGTWHITLTISSGSKTGTASGNVVVN